MEEKKQLWRRKDSEREGRGEVTSKKNTSLVTGCQGQMLYPIANVCIGDGATSVTDTPSSM